MHVRLVPLEIALWKGKRKRQDAHGKRYLRELLPLARDGHGTLVDAGLLVLRRMDRQEELLEGILLERDGQKPVRVGKAVGILPLFLLGIHLLWRRNPDELVLSALPDAGVVCGAVAVLDDLDQVLVVEQEFRDKLEPDVVEIAHPAVAVLEPELDDAKVVRQAEIDLELDAVDIAERKELERTGLELVLGKDAADSPAERPVVRPGVVEAHEVAQRRNGKERHVVLYAELAQPLRVFCLQRLRTLFLRVPDGVFHACARRAGRYCAHGANQHVPCFHLSFYSLLSFSSGRSRTDSTRRNSPGARVTKSLSPNCCRTKLRSCA